MRPLLTEIFPLLWRITDTEGARIGVFREESVRLLLPTFDFVKDGAPVRSAPGPTDEERKGSTLLLAGFLADGPGKLFDLGGLCRIERCARIFAATGDVIAKLLRK